MKCSGRVRRNRHRTGRCFGVRPKYAAVVFDPAACLRQDGVTVLGFAGDCQILNETMPENGLLPAKELIAAPRSLKVPAAAVLDAVRCIQ
jgi:hypothetical protein